MAGAGLAEVVRSNGVSYLIKSLSHPDTATRLLSLKLLVMMAPIGSARSELVGVGAAAAAERSCDGVDGGDAARCRALALALRDAVGGGGGGALDDVSASAWAELVAAEAEREAAIKRRDHSGEQVARERCDALRQDLADR